MNWRFVTRPLIICIAIASCSSSTPVQEIRVGVTKDVSVTWQVFANGLDDGRYEMLVQNVKGATAITMWQDGGAADRANLYLTRSDSIVVYGAGGARLVSFSEGALPRLLPVDLQFAATLKAREWRYLGSFGLTDRHGRVAFRSAKETRECQIAAMQSTPLLRAIYERRAPPCRR